ncbi:DUF4148 domain-containing protein [Noviherbaspirillum denitrificans]|uniref:DUF4148 domain-containing protein n=1 Tax=Noviherbaspirillum denitrificans TaxID=1968433 RepID=A0A254TF05_9BURK|nr:DUF4148 domain-containing protein [Noviherbaspirillum denitrificans]OWW21236.1 hypothetical protein AYR66_18930 [Noviherbaspirillum denitrificans]
MNTKLASIALAIIATSASAYAADQDNTRAQVRAELEQAYARGELNRQPEFVEHLHVVASKTRTAVRAELDKAVVQGQSGTQSAEFTEYAGATAGKTRAEVQAELEQAYARGEVGQQEEFVEHVRIAGSKSRDEVRDEAIRAAKARLTSTSGS